MAQLPPNNPFTYPPLPSSPPSPSGISTQWFSWVDELIDFTACTQTSHRRTVSDSIVAFQPLGTANSTPPSNHSNAVIEDNSKPNVNPPDVHAQSNQPIHHVHCAGETSSAQDTTQISKHYEGEPSSAQNTTKLSILDPKRVKRILANRQSARRSRERKLEYISKLESAVTTLTPRVAFLDSQRLMLVMQNSQLKHRIAVLTQDVVIKDALQESLKRELARLTQVHQRQILMAKDAMAAAIDAGGEDAANIFVQNDFHPNP